MCSPTACTFCAGMSVFGAIFMCVLGITIKSNFAYVGEWYTPEAGRGSPTAQQVSDVSRNCFVVMGIYIGFSVLAFVCLYRFRNKAKAA